MKRRIFLQQTGFGLAIIGASGLVLRSDGLCTKTEIDDGKLSPIVHYPLFIRIY